MTEVILPDSGRLAGLVTTSELTAAGWTDARIRTLVRRGVLVEAGRGRYARPGAQEPAAAAGNADRLLQIAAAVIGAGPSAVASHHDAAIVHGIDMLDPPVTARVAVTRPLDAPGSRSLGRGAVLHTSTLPAAHVSVRHQIQVTSAARTVIDLARNVSFRSGVVCADSALHAKLTTKDELRTVLAACSRWPGIRRARAVVQFSDARSESVFESVARVVLCEQRLPPPDLQVLVGGEEMVIGRVDFLWRDYRTVAEADGAIKYSDPIRAWRQLQRDAQLREAGFEVVHFTWNELQLAPWQVAGEIRAAFRRGRPG
jgi:very-short-patch-repair endonuclease